MHPITLQTPPLAAAFCLLVFCLPESAPSVRGASSVERGKPLRGKAASKYTPLENSDAVELVPHSAGDDTAGGAGAGAGSSGSLSAGAQSQRFSEFDVEDGDVDEDGSSVHGSGSEAGRGGDEDEDEDEVAAGSEVKDAPLTMRQGMRVVFTDKWMCRVIIIYAVNSFANGE